MPVEIVNPETGEVLDCADADALCDCLESTRAQLSALHALETELRIALASLTGGDTKTRRVRGRRFRAKIEMPDNAWDQARLKEAWHAYPHLRDELIRIDRLAVKLTELKKCANEVGPPDFETFRNMVKGADLGPRGVPRVTIEDRPNDQKGVDFDDI